MPGDLVIPVAFIAVLGWAFAGLALHRLARERTRRIDLQGKVWLLEHTLFGKPGTPKQGEPR